MEFLFDAETSDLYLPDLELDLDYFKIIHFVILGPSLTKLDLHHIDNIDLRAITLLSLHCSQLQVLKFSGCNFIDRSEQYDGGLEEDEAFRQQQHIRAETQLKSELIPFFDLTEICLSE